MSKSRQNSINGEAAPQKDTSANELLFKIVGQSKEVFAAGEKVFKLAHKLKNGGVPTTAEAAELNDFFSKIARVATKAQEPAKELLKEARESGWAQRFD